MRNAVGSADPTRFDASGIAWANAATGSRGTVTEVLEHKRQGMLCRSFTATREAYDGVSLYKGDICLGPAGTWATLDMGAA